MGILPQEELLGTVFNDHETDGDEWWLLKKNNGCVEKS